MQPCSNAIDQRRRTKTSMAVTEAASEFDGW